MPEPHDVVGVYEEHRCTCGNSILCEADRLWNVKEKLRHYRFLTVEERLIVTLARVVAAYEREPTKYRKWTIGSIKKRLAALSSEEVKSNG